MAAAIAHKYIISCSPFIEQQTPPYSYAPTIVGQRDGLRPSLTVSANIPYSFHCPITEKMFSRSTNARKESSTTQKTLLSSKKNTVRIGANAFPVTTHNFSRLTFNVSACPHVASLTKLSTPCHFQMSRNGLILPYQRNYASYF